ncbi:MAG: hypothetical protein COA66_16080, partial [Arcobacter sp.]
MLTLILSEQNLSTSYKIDSDLSKDILKNINTIVLQDSNTTMIVNSFGSKSEAVFSKIIDVIAELKLESIKQVQEYFDDALAGKSFDIVILEQLKELLSTSDFDFEVIDSLEAAAGSVDIKDETTFVSGTSTQSDSKEYSFNERSFVSSSSPTASDSSASDDSSDSSTSADSPSSSFSSFSFGGIGGGTDLPTSPIPVVDENTNDNTPIVTVDVSGLEAGNVIDLIDTISGSDVIIGTYTVTGTETTPNAVVIPVSTDLSEGPHTLVTEVTNESGNAGDPSGEVSVYIDNTAPSETPVGTTDTNTADTTPTISVALPVDTDGNPTLEAGDVIEITDSEGNVIGNHVITQAEIDADPLLPIDVTVGVIDGVVDPSITLPTDGTTTVNVGFTDEAGNAGPTQAIDITTDNTAPSETPVITTDTNTNDTTPTISVALPVDTDGNPTLEAGDVIEITDSSGEVIGNHVLTQAEVNNSPATVDVTVGEIDGVVVDSVITLDPDAETTVNVGFIDEAGNAGPTQTIDITIDVTGETAPVPVVDENTNDITPEVTVDVSGLEA